MDPATPQYGFVIDQSRCIGCHACTVACKMENDVPLGDFRTSVKYVEKGVFPQVRRHFTVLRCNHCDAAPCVEICPVNALEKRPDAIVDLDRDLCIGCTACMQACPYDAIYLNEDKGVAEKCHYCAHRTALDLEPACVNVCPVEAIISGPVNEPDSYIAQYIAKNKTSRRKVEKGTRPRVWYVDALDEALQPGAASESNSYLWSDRPNEAPPVVPGFEPTEDILTTLDDAHKATWGWHIYSYLMMKNIAAGSLMVAPFLAMLGVSPGWFRDYIPEMIGLLFLGLTNLLLVRDLGRPGRALKILSNPNTKSWLVKGAWVLGAACITIALALLARISGMGRLADLVRWLNLPVGMMVAGYSAFLFYQCKGRDLWLGKWRLFSHLLLQSALLGSALALALPLAGDSAFHAAFLFSILAMGNAVWIFLECRRSPQTRSHGLFFARRELRVAIAVLIISAFLGLAASVLGLGGVPFAVLAALTMVLPIGALFLYEKAWIETGQELANS